MARPESPKAIIEDGKIVNAWHLRLFWMNQHHQEAITRRAIFESIQEMKLLKTVSIVIVPQPPAPRYRALDQIKSQILNLQNRLNEHLTVKKTIIKKPQYPGIEL